MSDITNESERLRVAAARRQDAQAAAASRRRRKAMVVRSIVVAIDEIIGRPNETKLPAVAVLIADALVAGEIPHTRVTY